MMRDWTLTDALERRQVLKEGHFQLSSGRHGTQYLQCAQLLCFPEEAEAAGIALAKLIQEESIDLVVGPAMGGIIIAHEVARALQLPCFFTERKEGQMQLRRGFTIQSGSRIVVIEDVVTTGGSVKEVIQLLESAGGTVVAVGALVNRSGGPSPFAQPFHSLLELPIASYDPKECPMCAEGTPAIKPGSRERMK
ncbi:orotate phosphoribosyltransferase [Mechercharimyces sp. CAU 1602]|uniref:orotate phosphoribosyltransferase n=1 Tax=Mechercharimyces sp. CAU 1602 TaxID=2973933 RepID=UPI0021613641|nr:orotate phosphoribosyltransferase [Mechercharimyces sp. CAU 1602]MCS1350653.1 orotate phosphoribosyltransferase [Mechercharimyces sp. CAU 1602]